jgi:DNA-binding PadR family transcriptional regulator
MPKEITRMMILGVVAFRGPIGGYGIEKTLDEWSVGRWTTIAPASIYQQLRSLSSAGFIEPLTESSCTICCSPSWASRAHNR